MLVASFLYSNQALSVNFISELSPKELKALNSKKQILKTEQVKDLPWPRVIIYQRIKASPLEAMAIFFAVDHQKNYIPNLKVSKIIKQPSPEQTHVKYLMEMPWPISDSKYIHGHTLSSPSKDEYKVQWWMIESNATDKAQGYAHFIKHDEETIMKYSSLVVPKSIVANLIESTMLKDVSKTMKITKDEIERVKNNDNTLMKKYVSFILDSISGKFTFKK